MILNEKNANEFLGKNLYGGLFHYWPLKVLEQDGKFYVKDRNGVVMPVDDSNEIYFEYAEEK